MYLYYRWQFLYGLWLNGTYNYIVHGLYKPTYNCGAHIQYPLVLTNILLLKMAIEIVTFPII